MLSWLLLCLTLITTQQVFVSSLRLTQVATYVGVISWSPDPIYLGATENVWVEVRNVGAVVFKVTSIKLKTDWAVTYDFTDVPQVIDAGASYKFGPVSVIIPSSVAGNHLLNVTGWFEIPTSTGTWSQGYIEVIGANTVNIQSGSVITGPTTISLPTQTLTCDTANCYLIVHGTTLLTVSQQPLQHTQPTDWENTLLPLTIALLIILTGLVVWLIYLKRRKPTNPDATKVFQVTHNLSPANSTLIGNQVMRYVIFVF